MKSGRSVGRRRWESRPAMSDPCLLAAHLGAARPRVIAALSRTFRDVDVAEDGFQEASLRALERWPHDGTPDDPTAWLIRTARNLTIDRLRRHGREDEFPEQSPSPSSRDEENLLAEQIDRREMRDDVLRLLFTCCHDELEIHDQLALALKVIAGFSTEKLARAFIVKPKTMEQRITRAKRKAAATAAHLETPSRKQRGERLEAVSTMIYLLFSEGYSAGGGDVHIRTELCDEAIRLARLLLDLFPSQPELMGLLALCLLQHSRRNARVDDSGCLIPLDEQDRARWDRQMIAEGNVLVEKALRKRAPGPFQIQAAIAAVHCRAASAERTDWSEIEQLYRILERIQPSPVVTLNRAVAVAKTHGPADALALIDPLAGTLSDYLYFHSSRAALLADAGRYEEARAAYQRALELRPTAAETEYLTGKLATL